MGGDADGHGRCACPASPLSAVASLRYDAAVTPECRAGRDDLLRALIDLGISCRRGIAPIHLEPLYRDRYGPTSLPVTEMVAAKSMFLPMYASLSEVDQVRIIDAVVGFLTRST